MKKLVIFLLALIVMLLGSSSSTEGVAKSLKHGGYITANIKYTQLMGNSFKMIGGRGGYIFNNKFSVGAGGYALLNDHNSLSSVFESTISKVEMAYGGLVVDWIVFSRKEFQLSLSSLFGGGVAAADNLIWDYLMKRDRTENFIVVEPEINMMFNTTRNLHVGISVSYRLVSGVNREWASSQDIGGISSGLIFKFGWF